MTESPQLKISQESSCLGQIGIKACCSNVFSINRKTIINGITFIKCNIFLKLQLVSC